ncbi:MAG TPA: glutathione binding-like protein, partial [Polyangia bacterium]|nr:glutathione binding-like protein [Polyangia bacterium]
SRIPRGPMPFFVRPVARGIARAVQERYVGPQLRRQLDFVEGELGSSPWFAGADVTAADIQMSYPLEASVVRGGISATSHPRIFAVVERIRARPAYQRALERGGPVVPAV